MTDKILSLRAKKRFGATKEERSEKARQMALLKHKKMTKKQRREHALKMRAGIKPKKVV